MSLLKAQGGIGFFSFIYVLSLRGDTKFDRIAEKQIFRWSEVAGGRLGNLRWNLLLMLFFHREARRLRYFNTYRKEKKLLYECHLYTGSEPFADILLIPYCVCSLNKVFSKLVNAQVAVLQRFSYALEKLVCFQASLKGCNVYVCALTPQACFSVDVAHGCVKLSITFVKRSSLHPVRKLVSFRVKITLRFWWLNFFLRDHVTVNTKKLLFCLPCLNIFYLTVNCV